MKKIISSIELKAGIAIALCISFLIYPPLRLSSAAAATRAAEDLKSESQYRSEAALYDGAIRAISGIATMKLDTPDDIKKAIDILNRERPNLKFHRSKLVVLALSDSTFASAVKKRTPDKQAAEAFLKELNADRNVILKLEGAESLKTRLLRRVESDAATLRRAGERLKEAGERIKKSAQGRTVPGFRATGGLKVIRAGFSDSKPACAATDTLVTPAEPISLLAGLAIAAVTFVVILYGSAVLTNVSTEEGRDAIAECQERNDARLERCLADAAKLSFLISVAAVALCGSEWLARASACLLAS